MHRVVNTEANAENQVDARHGVNSQVPPGHQGHDIDLEIRMNSIIIISIIMVINIIINTIVIIIPIIIIVIIDLYPCTYFKNYL